MLTRSSSVGTKTTSPSSSRRNLDAKSDVLLEGILEKRQSTHVNTASLSPSRWQSRYCRLYEDVLTWYNKETDPKPAGMVPLDSIIYVVPLKKEDVRRFDMIVKGDPETWTFPFRAASEELVNKWVDTMKDASQKAIALTKRNKSPLAFDLRGRFWRNVVLMSITRERRKEAEEKTPEGTAKMSAAKRAAAVRVGVLKKKSPKLGIYQAREVELFPDVLLYREKGKFNSAGAIPLWSVKELKSLGGSQFAITMAEQTEEVPSTTTSVFTFQAETEELTQAWVVAIEQCLKAHGPETAMDKASRLVLHGDQAVEDQDFDLAVIYYTQALEISNTKEIQEKLLRARQANKKKFQESQNPEVRSLKLEGNDYFNHKEYEKALDCYSRAIELDPTNSLLFFNRAAAYHFMGKLDESQVDSRRAVELDPESVDARTRLGLSLYKAKKYAESRKVYEDALRLDPYDLRARKGISFLDKAEKVTVDTSRSSTGSVTPSTPSHTSISISAPGTPLSIGIPGTPRLSEGAEEFALGADPQEPLSPTRLSPLVEVPSSKKSLNFSADSSDPKPSTPPETPVEPVAESSSSTPSSSSSSLSSSIDSTSPPPGSTESSSSTESSNSSSSST